jgi:excisionase family DNA binding protein
VLEHDLVKTRAKPRRRPRQKAGRTPGAEVHGIQPLATAKEVAENLRVSTETVDRLAREEQIPSVWVRNQRRYDLNEVRIAIERSSKARARA